jgi:hypothetical protein
VAVRFKMGRRHHIFTILLFTACGEFDPDLSDLGDDSEDIGDTDPTASTDGDTETTGDDESGTTDTETDAETGSTEDTGGPVELDPNDPCDPLLEVEGIEICPDGYSCYLRNDDAYVCLPIYDDMGPGVDVGDSCGSTLGQNAWCYRSACGQDLYATLGPPFEHTQGWIDFCGPGQEDYCCTDWCDPNDPVQCEAGWSCESPSPFAPFGYCVPLP